MAITPLISQANEVNQVEQKNESAVLVNKMQDVKKHVEKMLGMPAILEVSEDPDFEIYIEDLRKKGWFIDVTVAEVVKAREDAAKTPDIDDDMKAEELAHRALCRFFYTEEKKDQ